ncbi:alpha beta hydrolase [Bifidobacterium myosotis]|uniref:Alpha beta hydrolase n=1 Tax=Bifidobacterium myosotis TaxID=1630166 RepID=A0A261FQ18_9BIFI|nr:HAD family phosphatase [Bifidobacterium myosotis]OZG61188.1 alpha beta hydrolase [Bifidobacterium myosotis]
MVNDVIFDFCGVLVDWQPRRALDGLFPKQDIDAFFADDDRCGFMYYDDLHDRGTDYPELLPAYEEEYGTRLAQMMRAYAAHIDRTLVGLMPGMPELLADLKQRGVRVWGLTNWGRDTWPVMAGRFPQLIEALDGVVVSGRDGDGAAKPDETFFSLALERFGVDRATTLFVDDSPYNIDGARAAGLPAIRFVDAAGVRARTLGA